MLILTYQLVNAQPRIGYQLYVIIVEKILI